MSGSNPVSPKVSAAALAAAVTTIVFFVLSLADVFQDVDEATLAGIQGAVITLFTFLFGYLIKDENREQGKGVPPG